jgi:hypothetical protein
MSSLITHFLLLLKLIYGSLLHQHYVQYIENILSPDFPLKSNKISV